MFSFTDHFFFPGSSLLSKYCVCKLLQRGCDVRHVLQVFFLSASILTIICIVWIFLPCPPCCRVRWSFLANSEPAFSSHIWTFSFTWMILLMTAWLTRSSSLEIFLKSIIFNSIVLMIDKWINDWMIDWMKQKAPLHSGFKCLPRALAAEVGAQLVVHLNSWCQHIRSGICCFQS